MQPNSQSDRRTKSTEECTGPVHLICFRSALWVRYSSWSKHCEPRARLQQAADERGQWGMLSAENTIFLTCPVSGKDLCVRHLACRSWRGAERLTMSQAQLRPGRTAC